MDLSLTSHGNDSPLDYIPPPPSQTNVTIPLFMASSPTQTTPNSSLKGASTAPSTPSSSNTSPTQSNVAGSSANGANSAPLPEAPATLAAPPLPTVRRRSKMACDTCHYRKIKCDVDKGHPCKNCEKNNVQCTLVGPAMRPPRSTSGSSSAAAAAAVAMAVAAAAAARQGQGQEANGGLHGRADHKGSFAPGHTSLTRRASASGSIVRSSGGGTNTTMEDAQLKAAIQAKARRSLLSSTSSPTSLRHLFKSGTNLTRSPSTSSTSSSSSAGSHPSVGGSSSRVSVHDALDLQSRSWNRPRIDRYAGSIAASRRTQREYFDYPFTKSSLATISAGHNRSPLWTSGLSNNAAPSEALASSGSPASPPPPPPPPPPAAAAAATNSVAQSSSLPPTPLHFPINDANGLSASEMSPISPVVSGFPLPIQQHQPQPQTQQQQKQQQQQSSHHTHHQTRPGFHDDLGAVHSMQIPPQQYHQHSVQTQQQQQHQKEQVQQPAASFHSLHQPQLQLHPRGMMAVHDESQSQQQYLASMPHSTQQPPHQHQHPTQPTLQSSQQPPPPRPLSRALLHKRKSSQPNLQRRASSSCLLSTASTKLQQDEASGLDYASGQTPPPQRRMSLNLHLQCQQQQQPVTIEPLDIDFGATLFNVPMDELQSAIKEQENTMNNPPPSQDMSPAQLNVHAQPQPQLQQPHLHHQPESFQRPQVQHQLHQSLQPVLSPDPHVHTMQPDQPVPPILLRSNSTPAVSRPRVGPIPASIHPFGFPANDDSVLYTPSHPFGSMAQHALNMYAMTDKITQDLSIPQQYYQMTPQAQLATTLQQLQVQIQMVQLQHPSSNQEPKSSQHSLPQSQPQHPLPIHPHHRHPHSQGPPPPPPQVLSQQHQQLAQPLPHHPQPQPSMVPSHAFFNEPEQMLFDEQTAISEYLNTSNAMGDDSGDTSMAQATNFAEDIPMLQGGGSDGGSGGSSGSQPPLGKENTDIRTLMDFSPFAGHMQPSHVSDVAAPSFQDTVMDSAAVDSGAAGSNMSNTATAATLFSMDSSGIQTPTMGFGANSMPSFDQSPSSEGFSGGGGGNIENPPKPSMLKQQRRSIQVLPSHYHQQQQQQQHYQQSEGQFHSLPHFRPEGISPSPLSSATQQPQHPHQQDQQAAFVWASGHQTPTYIPNGLAHLDLMIPQQQQQQQFQSHPGAAMQQFQSHQQTFDIHPHHTFQQTPLSFPSIMPQQLQQGAVHNNNINDNVNNLAHHRYEPAPQSGPELAHSLPSTFSMEQAAHVQTHQRLQFEQQMQQLQQQQHQHQ